MASEYAIGRYRKWYARLLSLYSNPYYERFGEGMEQTFVDVLRERVAEGQGLFRCALWMFVETGAGIIRENMRMITMKSIVGFALPIALALVVVGWLGEGGPLFGIGMLSLPIIAILMAYVAYKEARPYSVSYRVAIGIALAASFLLIWMSLGVGIIGSDGDPVNVLYFGVFAVGVIGAAMGRFEPQGMARALFATASAQAAVGAIAIIGGLGMPWSPPAELIGLNGFFIALYVISALLFQRATRHGLGAATAV